MSVQHVVIRREDYVAGTRDPPEVGIFTPTHAMNRPPVLWGRIKIGGTVIGVLRVAIPRHQPPVAKTQPIGKTGCFGYFGFTD